MKEDIVTMGIADPVEPDRGRSAGAGRPGDQVAVAQPPPGAAAGRLEAFHPGWYGAVMGTAIVGIIAYQNPGDLAPLQDAARALGTLVVAIAGALAIVLGIPYVARWLRYPVAARGDLANPMLGALYGTFPGGILVLAVGVATVGPAALGPDPATALVAALAAVGIILAIVVSVVFAAQLFLSARIEQPTANGTWFIPPVVTIIGPMVLAPVASSIAPADLPLLVFGGYALWGMGFLLFVLVASLLFDRLVFHALPPAPLAPSVWIGLGPLGVGGLALVSVARMGSPLWGDAAQTVLVLSSIGATVLWGFGLWWLAAAVVLLAAYRRRGPLQYGLGWWAFTFPLGAFTASTLALGRSWGSGAVEAIAVVLFVALLIAWTIVSARTLRAVASGAAWRR